MATESRQFMTKKSMQSSTLDFVITWVDGSDPGLMKKAILHPAVKPITGKNATATGII